MTTRDPKLDKAVTLLREVILSYTQHGENLVTTSERYTTSIAINVQAHRDDHGKIVGTNGQNIWALKTIFNFIGRGMQTNIRLTLLDPAVGEKQAITPFQRNPEWKPDKALALMRKILDIVLREPYNLEALGDIETTLEILPSKNERLKLINPHTKERNDFGHALYDIFQAIGKSDGHDIHIDVLDPDIYESKEI